MKTKIKFLMHTIIILSLLFTTANALSETLYWKGEIFYTDGTTKKGYIEIPVRVKVSKLRYKKSKGSKKVNISTENIKKINYISNTGKKYTFEQLYTRYNFKKEKLSKNKAFLMVFKKGKNVTFYFVSSNYIINNKTGTIVVESQFIQGVGLPTFSYYIRKKGQTFADLLGQTSPAKTMFGLNRMLQIRAAVFLNEDPELVKRIENGEFKHKDIPKIIDIYIKKVG